MPKSPGLIVILGATATGKTGLAIALAKSRNLPILSADSRQIYRHFDIGTAKPTLAERQGVPHYLIDLAEPDSTFTLAEYQQQAQKLIAGFHARGITPILTGGTGLYIKAIASGLQIPKVSPQPDLRSQLEQLGQNSCYAMLQQVDPSSAAKIHPRDCVRTLRALEVFYVTGIPLSEQQRENPPDYPIWQIGLHTPEPEVYRQWIGDRIEQMLLRGWLDEIRQLQHRYTKNLPLLSTLGYAEMADYLADKTGLATAKQLSVDRTYQFGKRQRTWFRGSGHGDRPIHWLNSGSHLDELLELLNLLHDREDR
ncbi:tRNA (adenosine(37)-N6)-dimethylallyltransferase MiaA [Tumidithrix helvetica PCC 7403]|uniref:tRNA (adenosine(37)-N6)-dimethylallyltransferase MiaA n=1 Tax=Tumidithrix helvetica TaxID=3457545 RepID=UPI003CA8A96B